MIKFAEYVVTWIIFMALIAAITLIVPKLAKRIDKWLEQKKQNAVKESAEADSCEHDVNADK